MSSAKEELSVKIKVDMKFGSQFQKDWMMDSILGYLECLNIFCRSKNRKNHVKWNLTEINSSATDALTSKKESEAQKDTVQNVAEEHSCGRCGSKVAYNLKHSPNEVTWKCGGCGLFAVIHYADMRKKYSESPPNPDRDPNCGFQGAR